MTVCQCVPSVIKFAMVVHHHELKYRGQQKQKSVIITVRVDMFDILLCRLYLLS